MWTWKTTNRMLGDFARGVPVDEGAQRKSGRDEPPDDVVAASRPHQSLVTNPWLFVLAAQAIALEFASLRQSRIVGSL